jgi:hypothetical protein
VAELQVPQVITMALLAVLLRLLDWVVRLVLQVVVAAVEMVMQLMEVELLAPLAIVAQDFYMQVAQVKLGMAVVVHVQQEEVVAEVPLPEQSVIGVPEAVVVQEPIQVVMVAVMLQVVPVTQLIMQEAQVLHQVAEAVVAILGLLKKVVVVVVLDR